MKKSELRRIIREEIQNLLSEQYVKTTQLKPGMRVKHKSWNPKTRPTQTVVEVKGKIMLNDPKTGNSDFTLDDGWIVEKWKLTEVEIREGLLDRVFDHFTNSANAAANKREVAKINKKVAVGLEKLSNAEEDLKRMLKGELNDEELEALLKKLS